MRPTKAMDNIISPKQMKELTNLIAKEKMCIHPMEKEKMESARNYIIELVKLDMATKADMQRLEILNKRLLN